MKKYLKTSAAENTKVITCGCASAISPPSVYPPCETDIKCLASGSPSTSSKFSKVIDKLNFTCTVDSNKNPFQDCFNTMARLCNKNYISGSAARISNCKESVNEMFSKMGKDWKEVRKECGQWPWKEDKAPKYVGAVTSNKCAKANSNLENVKYIDGTVNVSPILIKTLAERLWNNDILKI